MSFNSFISITTFDPIVGVALLILFLYLSNFLIQQMIGSRLPNQGEVSTIALSLTAFVLSIYLLLACWKEPPVQFRFVTPLYLPLSANDFPAFLSLGIEISSLNAFLIVIFSAIHLLLLFYTQVQREENIRLHLVLAQSSLCCFALLLILQSPDIPLQFLGLYLATRSLLRIKVLISPDTFVKPSSFTLNRLGELLLLVGWIMLMYEFKTANHDWLEKMFVYLTIEQGDPMLFWQNGSGKQISQPANFSATYFIPPLFMLGILLKSWVYPLQFWSTYSDKYRGSRMVWSYSVLLSGAGLFVLIQISSWANEYSHCLLFFVSSLSILLSVFRLLFAWHIHQILRFVLITQAGYIGIAIASQQTEISILLLISFVLAATLYTGLVATVAEVMQLIIHRSKTLIYHPAEEMGEAISPTDSRYMGGLRPRLPIIFGLYVVVNLSLFGLPPFVGFPAKVKLIHVLSISSIQWINYLLMMGYLLSSFLLAYILMRQMMLLFEGESILARIIRPSTSSLQLENANNFSEDKYSISLSIWFPLFILAIFSLSMWGMLWLFSGGNAWGWLGSHRMRVDLSAWPYVFWIGSCLLGMGWGIWRYRNKKRISLLSRVQPKSFREMILYFATLLKRKS